jgi:hypothetical protein
MQWINQTRDIETEDDASLLSLQISVFSSEPLHYLVDLSGLPLSAAMASVFSGAGTAAFFHLKNRMVLIRGKPIRIFSAGNQNRRFYDGKEG